MTEMIEFTDAQLAAMMAKIAALIATAESYDKDDKAEAAANYRAKAEELMAKYRIAEESLISEGGSGIVPAKIDIVLLESESEFDAYYNGIWYAIADHCGLKTFTRYSWIGGGTHPVGHPFGENDTYQTSARMGLKAAAVGYAADLRYAEFLWNATRLVFGGKLEPSVDRSLSDADNVYRLRSAGIERNRIATMIWGAPTHSNNAKVTRLYAAACKERGEDAVVAGRDLKAADYRTSYARGFTTKLSRRLQTAKDAVGELNGGLVLHGRKERVTEAFYEAYPSHRPAPATEVHAPAETGPCPRCEAAKTGECREHRTRKPTQADLRRWDRQSHGAAAVAGRTAGRRAAEDVKIVQETGRAGRVDASDRGAIEG